MSDWYPGGAEWDECNLAISLCDNCYCMTHTIDGKCGKCGAEKKGDE